MRVEIEFDTAGEEFFKAPFGEPARLVHEVANQISVGERKGRLFGDGEDSIGTWAVIED